MFANHLLPAMIHLPALPLAGFWFGDAASTGAESVDRLFALINWMCLFFFILIIGMMCVFLVKYQKRKGHKEQWSPSHSNMLEIVWSVIPTLLMALLFFLGFMTYIDLRTPPANAYDIQVKATQWNFEFVYPNGGESDRLHVPPNQPIRLVQQSADVIHSLYIPAFRTKMDIVPGRYTYQWFEATKPGEYDLFCAEYCGKDHSRMNSMVVVHKSQADFDAWLPTTVGQGDLTLVEYGAKLYTRKGCVQCHSTDGSAKAGGGPSFKFTYGETHKLVGGGTVVGNENYILESLRKPQAKIRAGYKGITMTTFPPSLINDEQVGALIAFIKSVSPNYVPEEETPAEQETEEPPEGETPEGDGAADDAKEDDAKESDDEPNSDSEENNDAENGETP